MDAADTAALAAALTEEQQEIRHTLRDLLTERAGPRENREATATPEGYDPELWARLSGMLGLAGLALPEQYGGAGHGPAALALACEETGRALAPSPLLATAVLAAPLIAALGTPDQRAELLPRIADGSLTCALAVPGGSLTLALGLTGDNAAEDWSGGGRAGGIQARAVDGAGAGAGAAVGAGAGAAEGAGGSGAGWRLYGEATQVLDGHSADLLLVAAHTGGFARSRTLLFLVRGRADGAPGLVRTRRSVLDPTRPQAVVELRDAEAELLGEEPADVLGALATTGRTAAALLAAEAVGAAGAVLDRTIAHLGARERSGRSEGALLAVKGTLADLYVQVEAARSLAYSAAREPGSEGGPLALAQALEALRATAGECVRLDGDAGDFSGGEAQLYFQRAASDELLFGPARRLRARAAERTGLFGEVAA
ncbi:acyl-CoA dehydrogenase family protein [Streptomyces sp. NPDC002122]|uniref:acyl-CoA dehydrogenase family protein n=1 Tax=Streptomyces sp. NPDC002122 TaxID=3154407 RepID=UPI003320D453